LLEAGMLFGGMDKAILFVAKRTATTREGTQVLAVGRLVDWSLGVIGAIVLVHRV